jgi:arginase family enzyme
MDDVPDLGQSLIPTDPGLFSSRDGPNDPRLGERVLRGLDGLAGAEAAVIGCPQDEGLRRNRGRAGAAQAPAEIRRALYRYPVSEAPGVSDPSPMGLTAKEVCEIADVAARDPRTRVVEITEVNPVYDRDGITARLAANMVMRALARGV